MSAIHTAPHDIENPSYSSSATESTGLTGNFLGRGVTVITGYFTNLKRDSLVGKILENWRIWLFSLGALLGIAGTIVILIVEGPLTPFVLLAVTGIAAREREYEMLTMKSAQQCSNELNQINRYVNEALNTTQQQSVIVEELKSISKQIRDTAADANSTEETLKQTVLQSLSLIEQILEKNDFKTVALKTEALNKQVEELEKVLESRRTENSNLNSQVNELKEKYKAATSEVEEIYKERAILCHEVRRLQETQSELSSEIKLIQENTQKLSEIRASFEKNEATFSEACKQLKSIVNDLIEALKDDDNDDLKVRIAAVISLFSKIQVV